MLSPFREQPKKKNRGIKKERRGKKFTYSEKFLNTIQVCLLHTTVRIQKFYNLYIGIRMQNSNSLGKGPIYSMSLKRKFVLRPDLIFLPCFFFFPYDSFM